MTTATLVYRRDGFTVLRLRRSVCRYCRIERECVQIAFEHSSLTDIDAHHELCLDCMQLLIICATQAPAMRFPRLY